MSRLTYLLLAGAIASEVTATLALRQSRGFTRLWPSAIVVIGYPTAFAFLAFVLKRGMPVATAYAIWSAIGVMAVALIGTLAFSERLSALQWIGCAVIAAGVVLLHLGG